MPQKSGAQPHSEVRQQKKWQFKANLHLGALIKFALVGVV